jgi:hypothetical protein
VALRAGLRRAVQKAQNAKLVTETDIRRLEEQLARVKRLCEFREYRWEEWIIKRAQIRQEQARLREQAAAYKDDDNLAWCQRQSSTWSRFGIWLIPASEPDPCPESSRVSKSKGKPTE